MQILLWILSTYKCAVACCICGETLMLGHYSDEEVWTLICDVKSIRANSQCASTKYWSMIHPVHYRKVPEGRRHCGFSGDHGYDNKINSMQVLWASGWLLIYAAAASIIPWFYTWFYRLVGHNALITIIHIGQYWYGIGQSGLKSETVIR